MNKKFKSPTNIHPKYPQVAVGAIVFKSNEILLVRRGKPPSYNLWAIPGGRVESGETLQEAAEREILEETGIRIEAREPVFIFDVIKRDEKENILFHYVIIDLMADYIDGDIVPGDDALDAQWFTSESIKGVPVSKKTSQLLEDHFGWAVM